jgi:hypothetical protein
MPKMIDHLFDGPIDVVGDVHGEIDPLRSLLRELRYDRHGRHEQGRRLVFVGDLVDRGPDSPAVLELVMDLVERGVAQCVLGNHEMNLLRGDRKDGNDWYIDPKTADASQTAMVDRLKKARVHAFLLSLPVALENDRLRVVHACWHQDSVNRLASLPSNADALSTSECFDQEIGSQLTGSVLIQQQRLERDVLTSSLHNPDIPPPFMPAQAAIDTAWRMENPVRVLTSGIESPATTPFFVGGKWRMVQRVKWWEKYAEQRPVIVGHYWRRFGNAGLDMLGKHGPDLFDGIEAHHWMGPLENVYCVDFSVGAKAAARANDGSHKHFRLAALRWPECVVVHDDGHRYALDGAE